MRFWRQLATGERRRARHPQQRPGRGELEKFFNEPRHIQELIHLTRSLPGASEMDGSHAESPRCFDMLQIFCDEKDIAKCQF
jgi:hypothetical protein